MMPRRLVVSCTTSRPFFDLNGIWDNASRINGASIYLQDVAQMWWHYKFGNKNKGLHSIDTYKHLEEHRLRPTMANLGERRTNIRIMSFVMVKRWIS